MPCSDPIPVVRFAFMRLVNIPNQYVPIIRLKLRVYSHCVEGEDHEIIYVKAKPLR